MTTNSRRHTTLGLALVAILGGCASTADSTEKGGGVSGDEEDLTQAPYLEVVTTADPQGKKIVAHGLPAVSRTTYPNNSGTYVQAALLLELPSAAPGYVGYELDLRDRMGSYTGGETPILTVDSRTTPPTVTLLQERVDEINAQLKKDHWSRLVEHPANANTVAASGWTVTYDGAENPKLHVQQAGTAILDKSARYFADYAFGPAGCTYTPELASAALSKRYNALLLRVHYATSGAGCSVVDRYFTEALP